MPLRAPKENQKDTSLVLFKIFLPLIAAGLSILGAVILDGARRALVASLDCQRALEAEQRQQLARLRDRDRRLELLLEQMPAALWSADANLRFTSARGRSLEAIGMATEQQQAPTMQEYFGTDDVAFPGSSHCATPTDASSARSASPRTRPSWRLRLR